MVEAKCSWLRLRICLYGDRWRDALTYCQQGVDEAVVVSNASRVGLPITSCGADQQIEYEIQKAEEPGGWGAGG